MTRPIDKSKGFTLIELLVVVAIIGMLAAMIVANLRQTGKKARDSKRKSDFYELQKALALYNDENFQYPVTGWVYSTQGCSWIPGLQPYFNKNECLPVDPKNTTDALGPWRDGRMQYAYRSNGIEYDLVTQLENHSDKNRAEVKCWRYHNGSDRPWVSNCTNGFNCSKFLYADH